jgi:sRNA-binding carbon storage regulator CsrA
MTKLFLERSKNEKVIIGEGEHEVIVEVSRIREHNVTLTFEASRTVRIDRAERRTTNTNTEG